MDIAIIGIIISIICAIPFVKIFVYLRKRYYERRYCFDIYGTDEKSFSRKINEIVLNPDFASIASLSCPQWKGWEKDINKKNQRDRRIENFRYVLHFLLNRDSIDTLGICGFEMNDVYNIIRSYIKQILNPAMYSPLESDLSVEIWKDFQMPSGSIGKNFKFNLHNASLEEKDRRMFLALKGDKSLFTRDEIITIVFPGMLRTIGVCREFPFDMSASVLFWDSYNVGLG